MDRTRILILGAAGRDFHTFNTLYREDPGTEVVAFTAQQIPHIDDRRYPPELSGALYPDGIPIEPEDDLERLIAAHDVDSCVLAYSDLSFQYVMDLSSRVNVAGAAFTLPDLRASMLEASVPVVAVCASRTGAGKSPTSRAIVKIFRDAGKRVGVIRHPMPYGDLVKQRVQRFETLEDLDLQETTIEEREEYEPHIVAGSVVWAGVDYGEIVSAAEKEADVLIWDGGNNDISFLNPDLYLTVVDPHRAGHETSYYPGEINVRMAHAILISKIDTADPADVQQVRDNIRGLNPSATVVDAACPLTVEDPEVLRGMDVLAIEDGPTVTHGEMRYGAASLATRRLGGRLVDPRPYAVGEIAETFEHYPHLTDLLPAMGYGEGQVHDLQETVARALDGTADAVAIGTPIDLRKLIEIPGPHTRVTYEMQPLGRPDLRDLLRGLL
ncbi:MAG: GTPase [Gemmatimonadota bacterium]|nr:GTPase [Gemmatimonadota bacterium]